MLNFFMPTRVLCGIDCLKDHSNVFTTLGSRAFIVTGKKSSAQNGSLNDVRFILEQNNIHYTLYNEINSNPSIQEVQEAAKIAQKTNPSFIIGIGGGSPLDAAKAIAILAKNNIDEKQLFSGIYNQPPLPIIAIPTTAGTGSEVTPYAVLTDNLNETKKSINSPAIFPKVAFLDAKYTMKLPQEITINTAIDALSHALEGYLSVKATETSNIFAEKALKILGKVLPKTLGTLTLEDRIELLYASMLAGVVISQTGTTAVHAMGYSLTFYKNIEHGKANGLLLYQYLSFINNYQHELINKVLSLLNMQTITDFGVLLETLLGPKTSLSRNELSLFVAKTFQSPNVSNTKPLPNRQDIENILKNSFIIE